jgi:hypothetical protein
VLLESLETLDDKEESSLLDELFWLERLIELSQETKAKTRTADKNKRFFINTY